MYKDYTEVQGIQRCKRRHHANTDVQKPKYREYTNANLSTESTQTQELQRLIYIEAQAPREKCAEYTVYTNPEKVISTEFIQTGDTNTGTERTVTQRIQTQVL